MFERRQFTLAQVEDVPVRLEMEPTFVGYTQKREYQLNTSEYAFDKALSQLRFIMGDHVARALLELDPNLDMMRGVIRAIRFTWADDEVDFQRTIGANIIADHVWTKIEGRHPAAFFEYAEKFIDTLGLDADGRRVFKSAIFDRTMTRYTYTLIRIE